MFSGKALFSLALLAALLAPALSSDSPGAIFLSRPAILPGNPLYGLKVSFEHISIAFSFSDGAKASRILRLADVRLSEIGALLALNRTDGLQETLAEYNFLLDSYYLLPSLDADFSRHARNLELLEDSVDKSGISEENRLTFSIFLSSARRSASRVGKLAPRQSFSSSARLDAERDLMAARASVEELEFFSSSEAAAANGTLRTAEILLREGEYVSASMISRQVYSESSGRISILRERLSPSAP